MDQDNSKVNLSLLILAGIGAGVLIGTATGYLLGRRQTGENGLDIRDSVDELRGKAEKVLQDLSGSINELVTKTQRIATDIASSVDKTPDAQEDGV